MAADLAAAGLTGPVDVLSGTYGLLDAFSDKCSPQVVLAVDLEHPAILDAAMKPYACCRYIHPVIDACCRLHASAGFIPADVDRITVSVLPDGGPVIADPAALRESVDHETVSMLSSACITALH